MTTDATHDLSALLDDAEYRRRIEWTAAVFQAIVANAVEGGTFRKLIYDRLGFAPDAWNDLFEAGGMTITNEFRLLEHITALPPQVIIGPGQEADVREALLPANRDGTQRLGCTDTGEPSITIHRDQPDVGKHGILLHEILHLVEEKMLQAGIIKRRLGENVITNLSSTLFLMLALSGLWRGVTPEETAQFLVEFGEAEEVLATPSEA